MASAKRKEKEKQVATMIDASPLFQAKFEERMKFNLSKFKVLIPLMPDALFDELYALLILEKSKLEKSNR